MLAITNARVLTIANGDLDHGTILIENGKIVAVGTGLAVPSDAELIDASGKWVMPGLIDGHTHVGIFEEANGWAGEDGNEKTDPATPHLRAIDAINHEDLAFADALTGGVTTVMIAPGSANVIGGEVAVLKCHGASVDAMTIRQPAGLKAALGENPKRVYGEQKKLPSTRMASAALLRDTLVRAQTYLRKGEAADPDKRAERDLRLEAVGKVLRREMPLRLHAHRADDILTALRIRDEFGFDLVIEHATEGYKIASVIAERQVPVMIGPMITARTKVELCGRTLAAPGILSRAGAKVCIITDHWVVPVHMLILQVIMAVRDGMPREAALRAVTLNPAEVMGIADRVGSLEAGKDADVQILSGDPLEAMSVVETVLINGERVYQRPAQAPAS